MWSEVTITLYTYNEQVEEDGLRKKGRKEFNNHKICILSTKPIYVFRLVSEKKLFLYTSLIGSYTGDGVCLLRGTIWHIHTSR